MASAKATTPGRAGTDAAKVYQIGGAGGAGYAGADGGAGAPSTLTNAVSGSTNGGDLTLYQTAEAGAGGSSYGGTAGAGAAAASSLYFSDLLNPTGSVVVTGSSAADGGAGGVGRGGSSGADGGAANASLVLRSAGNIGAESTARGGAGGLGGSGGDGGSAKAHLTAYGANVRAYSFAFAGAGALDGHASAKTKAIGVSGVFEAYAAASHPAAHLIELAKSAKAVGSVDGAGTAKAKVIIAGAANAFESQGSTVALQTADPDAASTAAALAANPNIAAAFGASPSFFSIGELGGAYNTNSTASETSTSVLEL